MKTHHLKISNEYFDAVERRIKNAEVRYNDRDYSVGDWLVLNEWDGKDYTKRWVVRQITYIAKLDKIGLGNWVLMCIN